MTQSLSRREALQTLSLAAATAAIPAGGRAQETTRPNVLLIHVHDLGRFLHCYGIDGAHTPHLDGLAAEGVRFANMFCTAPQCSPSRASLFTGRYPHNNGVMGLSHALFAWDLHEDEIHLGQYLRDAGYFTGGIGIIHETRSGHERIGLEMRQGPALAEPATDKTVAFLESYNEDRPFYLQVGFFEPHRLRSEPDADLGFIGNHIQPDTSKGITVPPYLEDTEGTRRECAELQGAVRHVDAQAGRILEMLRQTGLDENTLVIFTTDHGVAMPRAKCALYDPGLEVAFMLRYPGKNGWHGGRVVEEMMSNVDIVPSILRLVGIDVPDRVQGRSFGPLLEGGDYTPRDEIFGEITYHDYYDPRRSIRTHTHKLIANFTNSYSFMDPSQSWRPRSDTVVPPNHALSYHEPVELYDLENDPWERVNLAEDPDHAATRAALMKRLLAHLESTGDPILDGAVTSPMHRRTVAMLRGDG